MRPLVRHLLVALSGAGVAALTYYMLGKIGY